MKINFPVQIRSIETLPNGKEGQPRYEIFFDDRLSWCAELVTQTGAPFASKVGNPGYRVNDWVTIETTRAGHLSTMAPANAPGYFIRDYPYEVNG